MADTDPSATYTFIRQQFAQQGAELQKWEKQWVQKQPFLASRGYTLRPRYHPGWRPSWERNLELDPPNCEDFWRLPYFPTIVDATRTTDGRLVCIKRVNSYAQELSIANYFSTRPLREDPRNHAVPIVDSFKDDEVDEYSYIVMPFLRKMNDPPFDLVNDVLDFADQVLEGLAFMHSHDVAHRDAAPTNILMDADPLYPQGFHPVQRNRLPNFTSKAWPYSRFGAPAGVRYYFADFGLSVRIWPRDEPRFVRGHIGADRDAPELSDTVPYDPFKVDVFVLGNVFRKQIHDKYFRVGFLGPLIKAMTQQSPDDRPTAEEALEQWRKIRQRVLGIQRLCRLRGREEALARAIVLDVVSVIKVAYILAKRFSGWSLSWLSLIFC
ncbi:uncharacterized protein PHACADRAFT_214379 [Phanerochaete carnosa HHB-10118-sp]|uniref:Protein kinase domain-containing protein n=1 Tax=Phanerochaete carnosa (strain HHB-10118-sp) TaxID=650164 RepID=K5VTI6_PHACS|nr:uncharacterized protein PHACADRAFT_214379 [Phanerochaete carnosa HHB-10118-sp]EKM49864.1 hypothetical protein PHACADRAFT_214379 [Phanerochaete carnosa HHB-10118-sp]